MVIGDRATEMLKYKLYEDITFVDTWWIYPGEVSQVLEVQLNNKEEYIQLGRMSIRATNKQEAKQTLFNMEMSGKIRIYEPNTKPIR